MSRMIEEVLDMRGYYSSFGYCGLVDGEYKLFATEEDYKGNCGNISSGVGPFAIEKGLVEPTGD